MGKTVMAQNETTAAKFIATINDDALRFYAMTYWDFIMGRRSKKPAFDEIGYDEALAIRARLINIQ